MRLSIGTLGFRLLSVLFVALLSACASGPFSMNGGSSALSAGLQNYEDGNYKDASTNLQMALDSGLRLDEDRILAHKYLAFIHCAAGREKLCRDEFRMIFGINPKFDLAPAESGHPAWDPVFRRLKADQSKKK